MRMKREEIKCNFQQKLVFARLLHQTSNIQTLPRTRDEYTMNPTHIRRHRICYHMHSIFYSHSSAFLKHTCCMRNILTKVFHVSLVLMCYSCQLSTTFARRKILFTIRTCSIKKRNETNERMNRIILSRTTVVYIITGPYVHVSYVNLCSPFPLNVKYI